MIFRVSRADVKCSLRLTFHLASPALAAYCPCPARTEDLTLPTLDYTKHYSSSIALGHFARALNPQYQITAVLALLWVPFDQHCEAPISFVSISDLEGVVGSAGRLRQIMARLKKIGALKRKPGGGYVLLRPAVEDLDAIAKERVSDALAVLVGSAEPETPKTPRRDTAEDKAARRDALERLGKQPSDVRNVIARTARIKRDNLRYSGKGSGATFAAIDWLAATGSSWDDFIALCLLAHKDPDRPNDVEWLFTSRFDDYRTSLTSAND